MSDYTLLWEIRALGGVVKAVIPDPDQSSSRAPGGPPSGGFLGANDGGVADSPLSKAHISPFLEYRAGAGLLRAHRGGEKEEQIGGGRRGAIKGFSVSSRRRLLQTVRSIRLDAELPLFITLTYPNSFPDAGTSKKHLDIFSKRFTRAFPGHGSIWKLEPQKRGAPHYHILTWGLEIEPVQAFVPGAWFKIAGGGDPRHLTWHEGGFGNKHCVQQVYNQKGVMAYATKYLGKTFEVEGWQAVGRFWGILNRQNIPFGELVKEEVTYQKAVEILRYGKRFTGLKKHNNRSLNIFCDADQWIEKLELSNK